MATPPLHDPYAAGPRLAWRPKAAGAHLVGTSPKERTVLDILLIALGAGAFVLVAGYACLCDRI